MCFCSIIGSEINQKLAKTIHIFLNWPTVNSMVRNPGKVQVMFLGSSIDNATQAHDRE